MSPGRKTFRTAPTFFRDKDTWILVWVVTNLVVVDTLPRRGRRGGGRGGAS